MKAVKYSIFDLFSYAIPGALLLLTYCVSFNLLNFDNIDQNIFLKEKNPILLTIVAILTSYIIGFITNILGGHFYKFIALIIPKTKPKKSSLYNSTKMILLREFSPINFEYIEKWNSMKNMCMNLSIVIILSIFILLIKTNFVDIRMIIISLITITLLISKSFQFDRWSIIELDNAIYTLGLEKNCQDLLKSKFSK